MLKLLIQGNFISGTLEYFYIEEVFKLPLYLIHYNYITMG